MEEEEPTYLQLFRLYRSGTPADSRAAGNELFRRLWTALYPLAVKYLRGDRTNAEDLVQGAFAKLLDPETSFVPESKDHIPGWLARTLWNDAQGELRRRGRQPGPITTDVPDTTVGFRAEVDLGWFTAACVTYSERLRPEDWQILRRHYFEGISFKDIAESMGLLSAAVRVKAMRAREELREFLGADGWSPSGQRE